jgi:hypothetical protein
MRGSVHTNSIVLTRAVFLICAFWPIALVTLWLTTGEVVPTVNVRWASGVSDRQRFEAEHDLSLVWYEPKEPGTVRYFLLDTSAQTVQRIVAHPLIEDTAYINRGTFALDNPPAARTWVGDRFTTLWPFVLLYVSLFGCLIAGAELMLGDGGRPEPERTPARRIMGAAAAAKVGRWNTHSSIVIVVLAALFLAQATWFAGRHSVTYDETIYLKLAIQSAGDRRLAPGFMFLGAAPLAPLLTSAVPILITERSIDPSQGRWDVLRNGPELIRAPRVLMSVLVGVPLVLTVFLWLHARRGLPAATLGGAIAALSPTLIAHGSLVTTDASLALFSTLGLAALSWFANAPSARRMLVCAVTVAAAMTSKYSGTFLLPVACGVFVMSSVRRQHEKHGSASVRRVLRDCIVHSAILVFLVLPLWWGGHLFARATPQELALYQDVPSSAPWLSPYRLPDLAMTLAPVIGLRHQLQHSANGGDAFLMGERSGSGWWYYFPLAFLFKSTPAELALAAFLVVAATLAVRRPSPSWPQLDSSLWCLLLAALILSAALVTSKLNLGHRYMIPLYPILIIAACDRLCLRLQDRRGWLVASATALIAMQAYSSMTIAPHYLAYLNRFSGGPENGWRLLADSNLDWGQDLPALRDYLDAHPRGRVAMKYFGTALPEAYGVNADDIAQLQVAPEGYSTLALSATYLDGLHMGGLDPFSGFRRLDADSQVGYSIMLYDLRRSEALVAFREALRILGH